MKLCSGVTAPRDGRKCSQKQRTRNPGNISEVLLPGLVTLDFADFAPLKSLDFLDQARAARRSTPKRQRGWYPRGSSAPTDY